MTEELETKVWTEYGTVMRMGGQRHGQAIMNACSTIIPDFEYSNIPIDVWEKDYPHATVEYMNEVRKVY